MAVRPIVVWPDPRLREETAPITAIDDDVRALYRDLVDTMHAYHGIGIASVQIGVARQMFLLEAALCGGQEGDDPVAFVNPEVVWTSDETDKAEEGCLSFPGVYVPIERPSKARVRALNLEGEEFELEGEELLARAIQHEHDHLTGKLMVDFVGPLKKRMIKRRLEREGHLPADDEAAAR